MSERRGTAPTGGARRSAVGRGVEARQRLLRSWANAVAGPREAGWHGGVGPAAGWASGREKPSGPKSKGKKGENERAGSGRKTELG